MKGVYGFGLGECSLRGHRKKGRVPVLLFHRVSRVEDPYWPPLHPDAFRRILTFFSHYYRFLPVEDLLKEESIPEDAAFVTFDDAFDDFREEALPILQELQVPAMLFVPSGSIDKNELIWPSLVDRFVERECNKGSSSVELAGLRFELRDIGRVGEEAAVGMIKERLMRLSYARQMEVRASLEGEGLSKRIHPMSWEALRELPDDIGIGAHTVHHPYLPSVEREADIEWEMRSSKDRIEKMTGRKVRTFAYPFGGHDERAQRLAAEHFDLSFTTEGVLVDLQSVESPELDQRLPRVDIYDHDPKEAFLRVNGFHRMVRRFLPF